MASNVYTAAGTVFSISASLPAAHTIAGFEALTYTPIAEVVDGGSGGKQYNLVDHSELGEREVKQVKGSFTQGTRELSLGRDINDAGQRIILDALDDDNLYSFKILYQNGDINYVTARVTSYTDEIGTIDSIISSKVGTAQENESLRLVATGILTFTNTAGLTYDTDGDFTATQASTDGSGSGAEFSVTIAAGVISVITLTKTGTGYIPTEAVTLAVAGSTPGTAAVVTVSTIVTAL